MTRGELDRDAVLRIAAAVKKRGPGIVRRAHFFHRAKPVGIAVGLVTAVVLAAQWGREEAAVDARTCASWDDRAIENELDDGSVRLEIGRRALAVASTGSDVTVQTLLPCSTVLSLERGRVVVHARDLGGGELRVESGAGQVVVHGTVFAVERAGDRLEVEVAEGRVELIAGERIAIAAGKRARAEAGSIERGTLGAVEQQTILAAVGIEAPVAQAVETLPQRIETPDDSEQEKVFESDDTSARPKRGRGDRGKRTRRKRTGIEPDRTRSKSEWREPKRPVAMDPSGASSKTEVPESIETPNELMQRAQEARKRGDRDSARELFARAGRDLEAAWVSLCNMELDASRPAAAIAALDERQRRFGEGALSVEAAWLRVRALDASGDREAAREQAAQIVERWPGSPYAEQAKRRLEKP